jgi:uncharacterized protein YbjQ (UPF0145 family)
MGDPGDPRYPGGRHAMTAAQVFTPPMPTIREAEKLSGGVPYPLVDGLPRTLGWQWRPGDRGGPAFVIIGRGVMGGYKILDSFPLTADGWAAAWVALAQNDPAASEKVMAARGRRAAQETAASGTGSPQPVRDTQPVLIVTTNEIPGYRITQVHGDVFGLIVRARNYFSNLGASFRTLAGGEVAGYTKLLTDSRNQARERMWRAARARGANAVVAMRFDCNEIGDIMSEIAAYGTAVTVEPVQATLAATAHGTG